MAGSWGDPLAEKLEKELEEFYERRQRDLLSGTPLVGGGARSGGIPYLGVAPPESVAPPDPYVDPLDNWDFPERPPERPPARPPVTAAQPPEQQAVDQLYKLYPPSQIAPEDMYGGMQPKSTPSPGSAPVGGRPTAGGGAGASIQALVGGGGGIALPSGFPAYQGMPQGQGIMPQQGGEQQDGKSDFMDFLLAAGLAGLGGARDQWGRKDPMLNLSNALQAGLQSTEKKDEKAAAAQQQQLDNRMKLEAHRLKMEKGDLELRIKKLRYLAATAPSKRTSMKAARAARQAEQQLGEVVKQEGQFVRLADDLDGVKNNTTRSLKLHTTANTPGHPDQELAKKILKDVFKTDFGGGDDILSDGGDDLNKALDESGL